MGSLLDIGNLFVFVVAVIVSLGLLGLTIYVVIGHFKGGIVRERRWIPRQRRKSR
jgi:hypothetical protein